MTFNLIDDKHYLMLASGTSFSQNTINDHDIDYEVSSERFFLSDVTVLQGRSRTMLYLHASFMIVAWIGSTSVGIFAARFLKKTWVETKPFGKDFWFMTHQISMIITWILTISGFIIILVDSTRWSTNPHSILGTITFTLCLVQPIGAAFRPAPKDPKRTVFNFLHSSAGNVAHWLSSKFKFVILSTRFQI